MRSPEYCWNDGNFFALILILPGLLSMSILYSSRLSNFRVILSLVLKTTENDQAIYKCHKILTLFLHEEPESPMEDFQRCSCFCLGFICWDSGIAKHPSGASIVALSVFLEGWGGGGAFFTFHSPLLSDGPHLLVPYFL